MDAGKRDDESRRRRDVPGAGAGVSDAPVLPIGTRRFPRPDVAAALPGMGDVSEAGFELRLAVAALEAGPHRLTVTFRTKDGRARTYPSRTFVLEPGKVEK